MTEVKDYKKIGGWLYVVAFVVISAPFRLIFQLYPGYYGIFTDGTWERLTSLESAAYSPYWAPILIGELMVDAVVICLWLAVAVLFFSKKEIFPVFYIGMIIFGPLFIVAKAFVRYLVLPVEPIFDSATTLKLLLHSFGSLVVWVPYMLLSERVRETFVN